MDGYSDYVKRLSEARLADLRRDAELHRLGRAVRADRTPRAGHTPVWSGLRSLRRPRSRPVAQVTPLPMRPQTFADQAPQQRRSA